MTASSLREHATAEFNKVFGRPPQWVVAAPGRVNLIGEHVDYNEGFVLPMAVERYCVIAAAPAVGRGSHARIYSLATNETATIQLASSSVRPQAGHWSNYVAGPIAGCIERGMQPTSFDALIASQVPTGAGLSSSAALEIATVTLLEAMTTQTLSKLDKALICQKAEHDFAGVPCGIMDQIASVLGRPDHLMLLDCRSWQVEYIPFTEPAVSVLITNTKVKHSLAGSAYGERRSQCEEVSTKLGVQSLRAISLHQLQDAQSQLGTVAFRRARHVVTEIARTIRVADAVKSYGWSTVGRSMYESHESLRDDFEVSCPELDLLVDVARTIGPSGGLIGMRMTGAGFGGCTVALVETGKLESIVLTLQREYVARTGIHADFLTTRPGRGAYVMD